MIWTCGPASTGSTQSPQPAQSAAAPAAATLEPCSVIAKGDVEQVVGKPVGEGKLNAINKSICEFNIDEMGSAISFMLTPRSLEDTSGQVARRDEQAEDPRRTAGRNGRRCVPRGVLRNAAGRRIQGTETRGRHGGSSRHGAHPGTGHRRSGAAQGSGAAVESRRRSGDLLNRIARGSRLERWGQWTEPVPSLPRHPAYYSSASPDSFSARHPPSSEIVCVYPISRKLSATSAERNPPPQYRISLVSLSGTLVSMSRSMMPLPRCTAPATFPAAHSLSSRVSTRTCASPPSRIFRYPARSISWTRVLASFTSFRNSGLCAIGPHSTRRILAPTPASFASIFA